MSAAISAAEPLAESRTRPGFWRQEWKPLVWIVGTFLALYWLPTGNARFDGAVTEALALTKWYAREHVLLCLVPAFYIAGAISVFLDEDAVLRYLGPGAPKAVAYGVASVSGTILAVCSCTVLPLFAGIYMTGAGLGPAAAFLHSGPASSARTKRRDQHRTSNPAPPVSAPPARCHTTSSTSG